MTVAFDVSAKEGRVLSEFGDIKYPLLLLRFAPNREVSGWDKPFEWQIDMGGNIADYLDASANTEGKFCALLVEPDFRMSSHLSDADAKRLAAETPISAMLPHAIGIMTEDLLPHATPLMRELISAFAERGMKVIAAGKYNGTGGGFGPSHFLRDGVIYKRR